MGPSLLALEGVSASSTSVTVDKPALYVVKEVLPSLGSQTLAEGCGTNGT